MQGMHGRYLSFDLTDGSPRWEQLRPSVQERVLGGVGLGTWLLLRESSGKYDPLSSEAPLVFAFAPLAGTALNTSAKAAVVSKSPLTGRLNDAMISSGFALSGKGTGADAIVLRGACREWSTLFIEPGSAKLRETPELEGLSAEDAASRIKEDWGQDYDVVSIGLAGENQVPFAILTHDRRHAGRGGTGAVMGAKRLKALAVRGGEMPSVADPSRLDEYRQALKKSSLGPATEKYRTTGTLGNLLLFNRLGILPSRNFRATGGEAAHGLSAEGLFQESRVQRATCADCMIGCEKRYVAKDGSSTRLEYENVFSLGSLLDIWDLEVVVEASRLCDEYGLDTVSMGGTLAFTIECVEKGLLEFPGLRFGDGAVLLDAIQKTARKEGVGELLALGSRELSRRIGQGSEDFAPHVKGLEIPGYHPAGLQTLALGLAVGARGADHNKSGAYDLDLSGNVDRFSLDTDRIDAMIDLEDQAALIDSLIFCKFIRRAIGDLYEDGASILTALSGTPFTPENLRKSAREIHHLKKLFNQRQGWEAVEDTLPARFFSNGEPGANVNQGGEGAEGAEVAHVPAGIDRGQFSAARAMYYRLRGWGTDGCFHPNEEFLASYQ